MNKLKGYKFIKTMTPRLTPCVGLGASQLCDLMSILIYFLLVASIVLENFEAFFSSS